MSSRLTSYPLQTWAVSGFRSLRDETTFSLGGLNVLVGANSAGKSSVLQSLLMTAQTIGNPLVDRPILLNGPLVRLGLAADIVHEESQGKVGISFRLIPTQATPSSPQARVADLSVALKLAMSPRQSEFYVDSVRVAATGVENEAVERFVQLNCRTRTTSAKALRAAGWKGRRVDTFVRDNDTLHLYGWTYPGTAGARLRQFVPDDVLVVRNQNEVVLERLRWLYGPDVGPGPSSRQQPTALTLPAATRAFIERFLLDTRPSAETASAFATTPLTADTLAKHLDPPTWDAVREITATSWFQQHRTELKFEGVLETFGLPSPISEAITQARQFFASSVRHLGPLRAAPQPLYGLPEAASGTSVGRDGEYTAAVLDAHATRRVEAPDPKSGEIRTIALGESVNEWMAAMGLLSSVTSLERGKLGYEVHLRVDGVERDLDLTTVGVGVSQALPIVVLGLLAPPGSLLLLEQPELHLHPDVQAVLGDFFLALARSGRQLIVETHSEYLINRLRRRAVEAADVQEIVRLFFFQRRGTASEVTLGRLGEDGTRDAWPTGFLDTAAREIEAIARERLKTSQHT